MANKFHTYFGQIVTDTELNEIHDSLFVAISRFVEDFGFRGIVAGGTVTQHSPTNLTVTVSAPTIVYDQNANRMQFDSPVNLNLAIDENSASTTVAGSLNEKWLSIFIEFTSTPSDPRTDELGATVHYRDIESYRLNVVQGAEAPVGTSPEPALRDDQILIADVLLGYGVTAIINAKISTARTQLVYDMGGTPVSVREKGLRDVLQVMLDALNSAVTDVDTAVAYMDATLAAISVDTLLVSALSDSPISISAGTVHNVLLALLAALNDRAALLERANVFTAGPQEVSVNNAETAALVVRKVAEDHAGGNLWKAALGFNVGNNAGYVNIYAGTKDGPAQFIIAINALWDATNQRWGKDNTGIPAIALLFDQATGKLTFSMKTGTGTWTTWPAASGDLDVQDIAATTVTATGTISTSATVAAANVTSSALSTLESLRVTNHSDLLGDVDVGGTFGTDHDANIHGTLHCDGVATVDGHVTSPVFLYPSAVSRESEINILDAIVDTDNADWRFGNGIFGWRAEGTSFLLRFPIKLPDGVHLSGADVIVNQWNSTAMTASIQKHTTDWNTPGSEADTSIPQTSAAPGAGYSKIVIDCSQTISNDDTTYEVCVQAGTGAPSDPDGDQVLRVRVRWTDPGPRN